MIFQSSAVGEILLGHDAGWQVQRRDDGTVSRRDTLRKYSVPTFVGIAMAISAYAVSLPLLLWMMPVILGLLARHSDCHAVFLGELWTCPALFKTPEETSPPRVLARANELANASHRRFPVRFSNCAATPALREAHLNNSFPPDTAKARRDRSSSRDCACQDRGCRNFRRSSRFPQLTREICRSQFAHRSRRIVRPAPSRTVGQSEPNYRVAAVGLLHQSARPLAIFDSQPSLEVPNRGSKKLDAGRAQRGGSGMWLTRSFQTWQHELYLLNSCGLRPT